jgi:hypothetical protein
MDKERLERIRKGESIAIFWGFEDILGEAKEMGIKLTKEQAKEILQEIDMRHDATIGVNWDVLRVYIENYSSERGLESNE